MACFDPYADVDKEKEHKERSNTLTNRYLRLIPYPGIVSNKAGFFKLYFPTIHVMLCAQTFVLNKFLCCILGEYWLREDDVDSAISRFTKGVSKETLSNDFV